PSAAPTPSPSPATTAQPPRQDEPETLRCHRHSASLRSRDPRISSRSQTTALKPAPPPVNLVPDRSSRTPGHRNSHPPLPRETTPWGRVLGTRAGLLKATRVNSRHTPKNAANPRSSTKAKAGSFLPMGLSRSWDRAGTAPHNESHGSLVQAVAQGPRLAGPWSSG